MDTREKHNKIVTGSSGASDLSPFTFHPEPEIELRSEEFQEVLGSVPHWILRWGIIVLAVFAVILITGSAIFKYPDTIQSQVTLTGTTPPAGIVARSSGKLKELFVRDNQEVKAGDYLAVIDNTAKTEDVLVLKAFIDDSAGRDVACRVSTTLPPKNRDVARRVSTLSPENRDAARHVSTLPPENLQLGNLQNLYSQFYTTLFEYSEYNRLLYFPQKIEMTKERIVQYEKQYQNLLRQQRISNEQFDLAKKQFQRDSSLNKSGVISSDEFEKAKNVFLQSAMSQENMQSSVNSMRIQIEQLKESLLDTKQQDVEKSNNLQTQIQSQISQLKTEMEAWELSYVLKAPIGGKITFTKYWVENQNVQAGEDIFTVIPEKETQIIGKAMLPVARSGKAKAGQKVNIRLENFPENEFGILKGIVENISLVPAGSGEAVYYTVEISLPEGLTTTYRKELPYLPNMQGRADIITEDISLLERFVMPVKKILKENM